eukprot:TRINITY_DN972_c0_g1_i1.p1 TRINITY_DN972_c0_g1~~TRINITY_DN972_c0_g1_i1.p1  ORF type:complete len:289 (-),score=64.85 TRINITY_DN972_c0_g1_i1:89-886(-)
MGVRSFMKGLATCNWKSDSKRPFPLLLWFGVIFNLIPAFVCAILVAIYWKNACRTQWQVILLIAIILFVLNFGFCWYLNLRFNLSRRSGSAWARGTHILRRDPGMIVFLIFAGLQLLYNLIITIVWSSDGECRSASPALFQMNRVAWILIFVSIVGTILFFFLNIFCDCCTGGRSEPDEPDVEGRSTPKNIRSPRNARSERRDVVTTSTTVWPPQETREVSNWANEPAATSAVPAVPPKPAGPSSTWSSGQIDFSQVRSSQQNYS